MGKTKPIRLLIIALEYPPLLGGGATYVSALVKNLRRADTSLEISILTAGEVDSDERDISDPAIRIFRRASASEALRSTIISSAFMNDLLSITTKTKATVVHAHHSIPILAVKMMSKHFPIPSVYTQHRTPEHPGSSLKLDGKGLIGEAAIALEGDGLWVAPSHFFKSRLVRAGVTPSSVEVVWPSIDYDTFHPQDTQAAKEELASFLTLDPNRKLIVIPVVPRPRKDVRFVLTSLAKENVAVLISGLRDDSPEAIHLRDEFPDIQFVSHGHLSNEQLVTAMNAAHAVVLSSTHEGFGLAALESLSTGAQTFIRSAPGLDEIATRVPFAKQFHSHKELSTMIKRARPVSNTEKNRRHDTTRQLFSGEAQASAHLDKYRSVGAREYSAGGVCLYKVNDETFVRLVKLTDGTYVLPKGHRVVNESLEQAAVREVQEEAGITVAEQGLFIDRLIYNFFRSETKVTKTSVFFGYFFTEKPVAGPLKVDEEEGIERAEWVQIDATLEGRMAHATEYAVIKKAEDCYE